MAAQARALREWFRAFVREHGGKSLKQAALSEIAPLNRVLERDHQYDEIVLRPRLADSTAPSGLELRRQRVWRSPDALLLPIATSIAK